MTYEEFKAKYKRLVENMFDYSCDQAGSIIYASKIADLIECVPADWEDRADAELWLNTAI